MNAGTRRERLMELLEGAEGPVSAAALARTLSVSRQIIVGDIALLRAAGKESENHEKKYLQNSADGSGSAAAVIFLYFTLRDAV